MNKKLFLPIVVFIFLILNSCKKDVKDERADLSATISGNNFKVNDAKAILQYESLFSSKGQLSITGSDNENMLTLIY